MWLNNKNLNSGGYKHFSLSLSSVQLHHSPERQRDSHGNPEKASWLNPRLFVCTRKFHLKTDIQEFYGIGLVAYTKIQTSDHTKVVCLDWRDFPYGSREENEKGWCWPTDVFQQNSHKSLTSESFRLMRLLMLLEPAKCVPLMPTWL